MPHPFLFAKVQYLFHTKLYVDCTVIPLRVKLEFYKDAQLLASPPALFYS